MKTDEHQSSIHERLSYYLNLRNYDLEYSDDRLTLFEDLDNDPVIVDYLDSIKYRDSNIKNKRSYMSEYNGFCRALDSIAYYILKSEFKNEEHLKKFVEDASGTVTNNAGENNLAYKNDYKIQEHERNYGYPIMSLYAMNRNRSDEYRRKEVHILNEYQRRFGKEKARRVSEEKAAELLTKRESVFYDNGTYERIIYALKEPKNVLTYLRYELEVLAEVECDPTSEYYLISHVLEDVYAEVGFSKEELYIIELLKDGLTYEDISAKLSSLSGSHVGQDAVRYRVNRICDKISDKIKEKINSVK